MMVGCQKMMSHAERGAEQIFEVYTDATAVWDLILDPWGREWLFPQ